MNQIIVLNESDIENIDNFDNIIYEIIRVTLPKPIKNFFASKMNRKKILEEFGSKSFLLPDKLKFPVVDKNGKHHCGLIYAARIRAKQYAGRKSGYREIAEKAEELYKENKCSKQIHVQLQESNTTIDLLNLINILN